MTKNIFKVITAAAILVLLSACSPTESQGKLSAKEHQVTTQLIIRFNVRDESMNDFLDIMTNINSGMADEEGFIEAIVYRNVDNPSSFTLVEEWRTRALHEAHYDHIVSDGSWANILAMLTADPEMSYNDRL